MNFPDEIKSLRERALLTQKKNSQIVDVASPIVNRWKTGEVRPSIKIMKNIKIYCKKNTLPYEDVEETWLNYKLGGTKQ
ncbi:MAG: transcriptional regulator [Lachnospiraceae bacterium]|nr:transcriptional regulator [Lachnospiraceae bacterium]